MSRNSDSGEWRVATSRERIVDWAEAHGAVPVRVEREHDPAGLDLVTDPGDADGERVDWDEFFARFDSRRLALYYRPSRPGAGDAEWDLVDRDAVLDRDAEDGTVSQQVATGDTGDAAPVAFDEVDEPPDKPEAAVEEPRHDPDATGVDADDAAADRDTPMAESTSGAETTALVLDEISEHSGPFDSGPVEEYLVFVNDGDAPLDVSGWTVENDDGWSYTFSGGPVLAPGERVTLHSGEGTDTETERYWGAMEPVWDDTGDTVTVTTPTGERVLREPYEQG